ncbi:MAG: tRNA (adenosine(37)-N6)-threonylcarbamoyltransferase complex ATPase subunit type 1 TsaE [Sulfurimonas sp.]|nr:MAG: tRNA (adenosine(37)-N6)-threonylcarbamoyltransferase complex ATPase subunit type 1 TsaE [Sulfurimonas sp.]
MTPPTVQFTCKLDTIAIVVQALLSRLPEGGVVLLKGDLAAGKTTLVQKVAAHLGLQDVVTSPTFSIQQCYGETLFHYDIYNQGVEHFIALGLLEELEREGYHFIEWGDEELYGIVKAARIPVLMVEIEKANAARHYRIIKDA